MDKHEDQVQLFLITLGQRIRHLRNLKGLTQQELAALCNAEKSNISRIEAGQINMTVDTLRRITFSLNVHITELFVQADSVSPQKPLAYNEESFNSAITS